MPFQPSQWTYKDHEHFAELVLTITYHDQDFSDSQVNCGNDLQIALRAIGDPVSKNY